MTMRQEHPLWAGTISHNDLTGLGRDVFMAVHQMEHELSGMDEKIAHGAGLSALWASWARYVYKDDVSHFAQYAVNVWNIEMDFEHPENWLSRYPGNRRLFQEPGHAGFFKRAECRSCII